jgi:proline iminopeptidase
MRPLIAVTLAAAACAAPSGSNRLTRPALRLPNTSTTRKDGRPGGGVKLIPISTPKGTFKVWTKRIGNNPKIKVLLLHGGPRPHPRRIQVVDSYFPGRRHRVLPLRPAWLLVQRPAD